MRGQAFMSASLLQQDHREFASPKTIVPAFTSWPSGKTAGEWCHGAKEAGKNSLGSSRNGS